MRQLVTPAIILSRTDYGEADRIITLLTPEYGKLSLLAKGVRRIKSKLAGGIELFSVSEITFIQGRGAVGTLVSTRLLKHYGHIVNSLERTMTGYELIKRLNKMTEDEPEPGYFELLQGTFEALEDPGVSLELIQLWFNAQLLRLGGHAPNLYLDTAGKQLTVTQSYEFNYDRMLFMPRPDAGHFTASHIKLLRLAFGGSTPVALQRITGLEPVITACAALSRALMQRVL